MQHVDSISFQLQQVANLLLKESDQVLQEQLGIGMSQFRILKIVQSGSVLLQRQIATTLNQTEASISRQIKLLHRKQLLVTRLNPKDRREHVTSLTPKGTRLIAVALEVLRTFQAPLLGDLSDKQQIELLSMLDKIEQALS